jgi:hypothetical protein
MTDQRRFPFFVNGEFWKEVEVSEDTIKQGYCVTYATTRIEKLLLDIGWNSNITKSLCKNIVFRLAEMVETKGDYTARWFSGFWVFDSSLYLEDGKLYYKEIK